MTKIRTAHNRTLTIAGVSSFADSFVVNESAVLRMNFCAKKPRHRQSAKRRDGQIEYEGVSANRIAKWDGVSLSWSALGSGMSGGDVIALAVTGWRRANRPRGDS